MQVFTLEQEERLLTGLRQRDEAAFDEFYQLSRPFIRNLLLKKFSGIESEIDDILQQLYVKIWQKIELFGGRCRLTSWVYQVGARLVIDKVIRDRHRTNCRESLDSLLEEGWDATENSHGADTDNGLSNKILELKNSLGEKHLAVFNMRYEQGLSVNVVARKLKVPKGTVMSRSYDLRDKIRKELGVK